MTFLGTAAAPSMPVPFCVCTACVEARRKRGKNLRRRSSILVNRDLLVDLGPDVATASFDHGVAFTETSICLLTHSHEDHFAPEFIICRHSDYGAAVSQPLVIAGSAETIGHMDAVLARRFECGSVFDPDTQSALQLSVVCLEPFQQYQVGVYRVTPYPANHGAGGGALLYSIEEGQQAMFYGTDTSGLSECVWQRLGESNRRYDLVILDQTYGIGVDSRAKDHMSASNVAAHAERFRTSGLLKNSAVVYAIHISHEGCLEHEQLDRCAAENGYRIAYDGLVLELGNE